MCRSPNEKKMLQNPHELEGKLLSLLYCHCYIVNVIVISSCIMCCATVYFGWFGILTWGNVYVHVGGYSAYSEDQPSPAHATPAPSQV